MLIEVSALKGAHRFHLSEDKGFLPRFQPVVTLPPPFQKLELAARELPERLAGQEGVRAWIDQLFRDIDPAIYTEAEKLPYAASQTLMLILSLLGHAYRWNTVPPKKSEYDRKTLALPELLDRLWSLAAAQIGQLRVAAFWNTNLCNWKLKNPSSAVDYALDELTADNIELIYNWLPEPSDRDAEVFKRTFILADALGRACWLSLCAACMNWLVRILGTQLWLCKRAASISRRCTAYTHRRYACPACGRRSGPPISSHFSAGT